MKKLYLFIFLIVIALSQHTVVNANAYKLIAGKVHGAPAAQTITSFAAFPTAQAAGFADIPLSATASSNSPVTFPVTYTSSNTSVATITGTTGAYKIHYVGIGTALITASQAGDNVTWQASNFVSQPLTVTPVITFANLGNVAFSTNDLTLTATTTATAATFPITYTTSDPTIATITGTAGAYKLHFVGLGPVSITATEQGSLASGIAYTAATKTATATVVAGTAPVITWTGSAGTALQSADLALGATSTFNSIQYPIIYTINPAAPTIATIVNNRLHMVGTGTVTIVATEPGNGKFADAAPVSANFTISAPAAPTIGAIASKVLGTADFDPAATFATTAWSSTITYTTTSSNISIVNNKVHLISVGTSIPITAVITYPVGAGGTNTVQSVPNTSLAITAAPLTNVITINSIGTFGGTANVLNYTNLDVQPLASSPILTTPITFSIDPSPGSAYVTMLNGNIHFTAVPPAGLTSVTLRASQPGTGIPDATLTFSLSPPLLAFINTGTFPTKASAVDVPLISSINTTNTKIPGIAVSLISAPVTLTSSNPAVAVIINGGIHLTGGLGATVIKASQQNSPASVTATATATLPADAVFTLNIAAPTALSFGALGVKQLTSTDFNLTPSSSPTVSGGVSTSVAPYVFTSSNPAVATMNGASIHYTGSPAPPNNTTVITVSQGGGPAGTSLLPPDVSQILTVSPATITFPAIGIKAPTPDFNPGASSTFPSTFMYYYSSNPAVLSIINTLGVTGIVGGIGSGYVNGTYTNVPLTGGSGNSSISSLNINPIVGGSGYTNGTYYAVPLTGGTGSGATGTITVAGGTVTSAVIVAPGSGYTFNDQLSASAASIGGTGSGFNVKATTGSLATVTVAGGVVTAVTITTSGTGYTNGDILSTAPINLGSVPPQGVTIPAASNITSLTSLVAGTGYTNGTYNNVPLIGGTGYSGISSLTTIVGGSGYTDGTYTAVPLTGGTGTNATATITVLGGKVTSAVITPTSAGSGYTYNDVLSANVANIGGGTTGSGFSVKATTGGALATITVAGSAVISANITTPGTGYTLGDILTVTPASVGGTGSGFSIKALTGFSVTVNAYTSIAHFNVTTPVAANNSTIITASQGGGVNGTPTQAADVSQVLTLPTPTITFPPLLTKTFTTVDLNPGATASYTTGGSISTIGTLKAGSGYNNGVYYNVPLTGGTGTGAQATVTVVGNIVTAATITTTGINYSVNDLLTAPLANIGGGTAGTGFSVNVATISSGYPITYTSSNPNVATIVNNFIHFVSAGQTTITASQNGLNGFITTIGTPTGGSAYTNGTYNSVPLTYVTGPGTGTGALATITVAGGSVSSVLITNGGAFYKTNDVLTASAATIGGTGTGFSVAVTGALISNNLSVPPPVQNVLTVAQPAITFAALGSRNFSTTDFSPGATSTVTTIPVTYAVAPLPNPQNVISINNGGITSFSPLSFTNRGTQYTQGTYTVPLTGGTGTGATATILVGPISASLVKVNNINTVVFVYGVQSVILNSSGSGYTIGDVLTAPAATIGGTGSGFNITVSNTGSFIHEIAAGGPVTIIATQGGGVSGKSSTITGSTNLVGGSAYTNGTYPSIPLTGGTGTGAVATITVAGGAVTSAVITTGGTGYVVGDVLTATAANIGGTGSGFALTVSSIATLPPDVPQTLTVLPPVLTFPALTTQKLPVADFAPGASSTLVSTPITYTSDNAAVTILPNSILQLASTINFAGNGYQNGVYTNVPLTGGTGSGAIATITVIGNTVTSAVITSGGTGYTPSDNLTTPNTNLGGVGSGFSTVATVVGGAIHVNGSTASTPANIKATQGGGSTGTTSIINFLINGGTGYTNGTYTTVPLTGGTGTGASANIIVANGTVAFVSMVYAGSGYVAGDVLTAAASTIGGTGTGFSITAVAIGPIPADISQPLTIQPYSIALQAIGTKTLTDVDYAPVATSTNSILPITYTSSNTAVATIVPNANVPYAFGVSGTVGTAGFAGGSGYTNGTYINVPLVYAAPSTGAGSGATANVTVSGGIVSSVSLNVYGTGYKVGDVLTATAATIGGTGSGFTASVNSIAGYIHYLTAGTTTIEATQQGSPAGVVLPATVIYPADATQTLTLTAPQLSFAGPFSATTTISSDFSPGAISTLKTVPINYISTPVPSTAAAATTIINGSVTALATPVAGVNYVPGTYNNVALSGGSGSGVLANITVIGGGVANVTITKGGTGYVTGNILTTSPANLGNAGTGFSVTITNASPVIHVIGTGTSLITATQGGGATGGNGSITALNTLVGGSAYTNGTYTSVPLTYVTGPGTGTTALATIVVSGGIVTSATITSGGKNYVIGDVLTAAAANVGGTGTGFSIAVSATAALPADVSQSLTINAPVITFPALGFKTYSNVDILPGATSPVNLPITYTSNNTSVASIVNTLSLNSAFVIGSGYVNGTYTNVPLTGGKGSSTISGLNTIVGGTGYTNGTYVAVPLTGGTGSGATATITVAGNVVTSAVIVSPGTGYTMNDQLSASVANIGGGAGSGFTVNATTGAFATITVANGSVALVNVTNSGSGYAIGDILSASAANIGGSGSGFNTNVTGYNSFIHYNPIVTNASTTITASQGGGPLGGINSITKFTNLTPGSGYVNGTYTLVPLTYSTAPTVPGINAAATITVAGGVVTSVVITSGGSGYSIGDVLTCAVANIGGGTGTGFSISVSGTAILPADATSSLTVTAPVLAFPAPSASVAYTNVDYNPGATSSVNLPITYTSGDQTIATITPGNLVHFIKATITTPATPVIITASQGGGASGSINGITKFAGLTAGSAYAVNGTYTAVPLIYSGTAKAGTNAKATITVAGGSVTSVVITSIGSGYAIGDLLTAAPANIGGAGTGFSITVSATATLPADVTLNLTITGGPQIIFTATQLPATKALTSTDLAPGATSTLTTVPITYTSSDPTVVSVLNGNLHFLKTGNVIINASQQPGGSVFPGVGNPEPAIGIYPADVQLPLAVTAAVITFTATQLPTPKPISNIDFPLTGTSTLANIPLTYTSSDPNIATIVNPPGGGSSLLRFAGGIGTVTIRATQQGTLATATSGALATATLPADASVALVVNAPAITFTLASKPFQIIDLNPGATSTLFNIPITYTSSDPNVATIVNGNIHFVGIGTTTITASQQVAALAAGLAAPADVAVSFTVTAPTLTFSANFGSRPFNSSDIFLPTNITTTLDPTAPITYTSSDPTVATIVNGNAVHYVGLGTTVITATQAPYLNSPTPLSTTATLTVTPAVISIGSGAPTGVSGIKTLLTADINLVPSSNGPSSTLSTSSFPLQYNTSDPTVATVIGGLIHIVGVGNAVITQSQSLVAPYAPLPIVYNISVVAPNPLITFNALGSIPYTNNGDIALTATSTSLAANITYTSSNPAVATIVNGNIHFTPPSIVNGVVTYPSPNTTIITASQGGGVLGTSVLPPDVQNVLTELPASFIFPALGTKPIGTPDFAPGATSTYTLITGNNVAQPIAYTSSDQTVATITTAGNIHLVGPGTTTITASIGNIIIPDISQNLVVTAPTLTFGATASKNFSSNDVPPGAISTITSTPITYTSSNANVATIVNSNIHFVGLGVTTIIASQVYGSTTISQAQTLTVTAPVLTFAVTRSQSFSLQDLDPGATSTLLSSPITYTSSNPAVVTIVNNRLHFIVPPSVPTSFTSVITATQAASGSIPAQSASQVLTVLQTIIMPAAITKYYGDGDFTPGSSTYGPGYPVTFTSATAGTATVVNNGTAIHIVAPGTSTITALQSGDILGNANTVGTASGQIAPPAMALTVLAAPLTITPKNVTVIYGSAIVPVLPVSYTGFKSASGTVPLDDSTKFTTQPTVLINGQTPNGNFTNLPVGTYLLTASGAASTLYTFTYGTGTLTVKAPVQTLTWTGATTINKLVSDPDFDPLARSTGDPIVYTSSNTGVATITSGIINTTQSLVGGSAYADVNSKLITGSFPVTLTGGSGTGATANITLSNGVVLAIAITAGGSQYKVGDILSANPASFGAIQGSGFSITVGYTTSIAHITGVGTTQITASLTPTTGNYLGSPAPITKTYIVGPGNQIITVGTIPFLVRNSGAYTPTATSTSGLPVSVSVTDPSFVNIVNGTIVPLHVGTTKVSFTQAGNTNYAAADTVNVYVKVIDGAGGDLVVHKAVSPDGDGINDFLYIEGVNNFPVNHVKIIDRNGGNVFETDNYDNKTNVFTGKSGHNGKQLPGGTYFYIVDYTDGNQRNHITGYFVLKY